jgi:hypothetical protein
MKVLVRGEFFKMGFGKGVVMTGWVKWATVAAVGLVAVPVMGLTIMPSKGTSKTPAKLAAKVTHVSTNTAKKTLATKPVVKNTSPRPASVRLGKNVLPANKHGHVGTPAHATLRNVNIGAKKPVMMTRTPVRPTTLHGGPAKLPTPKSTLSKAMEKTHTPSSPMKSSVKNKPVNVLTKSEMN